MIDHLRSLNEHGMWADARMLAAVQAAPDDSAEALRELSHVRGAQEIWLTRLEGTTPTIPVWPAWSAAELADASPSLDARLRAVIDALTADALAQPVHYRNLAGAAHETALGDILLHVMMHGQYHRGRANIALKSAGKDAVGVDYMLWKWTAK